MHVKEQTQSLKALFETKENQQQASKTSFATIFAENFSKNNPELIFARLQNQSNDLQNYSNFNQSIYACQRTNPKFENTV